MKRFLLALLLAALHSATARADGFFDPPEPTPERRAELDALCSRMEALGLPTVPPEAEWVCIKAETGSYHFRVRNDVYFDQYSKTARGNAWRLPSEESGGTNVFVTVDGRRIVLPPDSSAAQAWERVRIQRDIVGLHKALDENANVTDEYQLDSVGKSLLFATELFRSGREAAADALVAAIERDSRGLSGAERDAAVFRARADVRAAGLAFYASGDFAALAAALKDSLRRIPPLGKIDEAPFENYDSREDYLTMLRPRLAGEQPPELEGLDEENQSLARALADEPAGPNHYENPPHFYHDNNLPWLLPAAWTNFVANADDVQTRILRRGPAALPLLAAMAKGNAWPVVGDWRNNGREDENPPFCTRADAAKKILTRFVFATLKVGWEEDRSAVAARLRDRLANATEDDVARFYLAEMEYGFPNLLEAWLARRTGAAPLPWLEEDILAALHGPFVDEYGTKGLTARLALHAADAYLAVRGESAAAFRDRLVETLQTVSKTATYPEKTTTPLPDGMVRTVEYIPESPLLYVPKLRAWAAEVAGLFADLKLSSGAPDDIRRRGETLATWHDRTGPGFKSDPPSFPPIPLPLLATSSDLYQDFAPPRLSMRISERSSERDAEEPTPSLLRLLLRSLF